MDDASLVHRGNPQSAKADSEGALMCNICEISKSATVFCVACQKTLCADHKKEDQEKAVVIGNPVHFHVKVAHYMLNKQAYVRQFCKQHPDKEITHACKECKQTYCPLCDTEQDCPLTHGAHSMSSLAAMAKAVQEQIKDFQSSLAEKSTRSLELVKDALKKMETVDEASDRMVAEVERKVREQIELMKQEGELKKQEITRKRKDTRTKTDGFIKRAKKSNEDALEQISSLQAISQLSSPGLLLEKFFAIESKVKAVVNTNLIPFTASEDDIPCTKIVVHCIKQEAPQRYVSPSLKFICAMKAPGNFSNTSKWITRDLMVTGGSKVTLLNGQLKLIRQMKLPGADDVIPYKENILVLQKQKNSTKRILIYSTQLEQIRVFATLPSKSSELSKIAAVCDRIVASDPSRKCLHIWDSNGNPLPKLDLSFMKSPRGVFATADGCALVSDSSERGSVYKYSISTSYSCQWKSDELEYPWSIAVTNSGKILVNSNKPKDKAIYHLSAEGKLLSKFTCSKLRYLTDVNDISIINAELVAACRGSGLKFFQLSF